MLEHPSSFFLMVVLVRSIKKEGKENSKIAFVCEERGYCLKRQDHRRVGCIVTAAIQLNWMCHVAGRDKDSQRQLDAGGHVAYCWICNFSSLLSFIFSIHLSFFFAIFFLCLDFISRSNCLPIWQLNHTKFLVQLSFHYSGVLYTPRSTSFFSTSCKSFACIFLSTMQDVHVR